MENSTELEEIYRRFLPKITCYEYLKPKFTKEMLEISLDNYIESVLAKYVIDTKLEIDFKSRSFNRKLKKIEIEIFIYGLIVEWITPYRNNTQWLKQNLKSSEYSTISEANQLRAIESLYVKANSEFEYWMTRRSHMALQDEV
ncbi:MAG: hypothetical protein RSA91_01050 [Bacilli bacterium]